MNNHECTGFLPQSITLDEMMREREFRASESMRLINDNKNSTIVCMTMNFIGEYKLLPLSYAAFLYHYKLLQKLLCATYSEKYHKATGDVAFFISDMPPKTVKHLCERVEDNAEIGRLFDIDVFDTDGIKLTRETRRKCLLCDKPAAECSRSRAHGVNSVREKTINILKDYFEQYVCTMAHDALIDEVDTTPKPGLVDRNNSGANSDMDYNMFIDSSNVVAPYIGKLFSEAVMHSVIDSDFAEKLRLIGLDAENSMYSTTGGINTHKGAIYSMGLLSSGIGFTLSHNGKFTEAIDVAARLALELSYDVRDENTHGLNMCQKYGVTGARGEAIGGFHTVLYAFERIKHYVDDRGLDTNTAYPLAINDIMAVMKDTNVLHRAGIEGLKFMNKEAKEISEMRENQRIDDMLELDKELIKRNISPGGCADVLACAIFLLKAEKLFIEC